MNEDSTLRNRVVVESADVHVVDLDLLLTAEDEGNLRLLLSLEDEGVSRSEILRRNPASYRRSRRSEFSSLHILCLRSLLQVSARFNPIRVIVSRGDLVAFNFNLNESSVEIMDERFIDHFKLPLLACEVECPDLISLLHSIDSLQPILRRDLSSCDEAGGPSR